jgi:hypothetical protein
MKRDCVIRSTDHKFIKLCVCTSTSMFETFFFPPSDKHLGTFAKDAHRNECRFSCKVSSVV